MTNILVVEDNAGLRRLIGIHLRRAGYEVSEAADGQAALDLLEHSRVHLIITDVMMPNMDGLDATRAIRALDRADAKVIPIIAMTANAFEEDARKCMEAGMNAHLPKPIRIERLTHCLRIGKGLSGKTDSPFRLQTKSYSPPKGENSPFRK